ncbi:hypothetical protein [Dulcicalothrix desertica]|uniref:hypothetical protein n=1 Tax=Dulcicalothrix desertica TaxID=32056 RepID=UPI002D772183|nr:hypothetical protein [Dulcicalothrix desertica]
MRYGSVSVEYHESISVLHNLGYSTGTWISGKVSEPPASSSNTFVLPSSVRRLITTQPAEAAPMII